MEGFGKQKGFGVSVKSDAEKTKGAQDERKVPLRDNPQGKFELVM